jgi:hypothetical protein
LNPTPEVDSRLCPAASALPRQQPPGLDRLRSADRSNVANLAGAVGRRTDFSSAKRTM